MKEREYKQQMITKCLIDMDMAISSLIGLGVPKKIISERASLLLCRVNGPKESDEDQGTGCA